MNKPHAIEKMSKISNARDRPLRHTAGRPVVVTQRTRPTARAARPHRSRSQKPEICSGE